MLKAQRKAEPHTGRPVVESIDKITEIIVFESISEVVASPRSFKQFTLNYIQKKKGSTNTKKHGRSNFPFLKWMVAGEEKRFGYVQIVQKRLCWNYSELVQTLTIPELTAKKLIKTTIYVI